MGEACTALSHPFPAPRLARRMSYPALRVPGGSRGDPMIRGDQGGPPDNHRQGGRGFPEPPGPVASPPNNQSYVHPKRGVNLFCKRDHITIGYLGGGATRTRSSVAHATPEWSNASPSLRARHQGTARPALQSRVAWGCPDTWPSTTIVSWCRGDSDLRGLQRGSRLADSPAHALVLGPYQW